ncbi:Ribosome biogenesis GTP-binding protein YsxC,related [Neospora caninum Liverpool]|nr:Ribosome biogenesis GTP-binding protein YsxC,related [Neospora caninum Liverpool]CBZ53180.1 Ribosome biogenesis GTP-binding protein YsxC,related [Neospora caninum Liverpool]|eukprot:XP_003883212.1 Ribosome biogenesis GTP-binding protein YsxC,related [Neospora caninum Liverpool]
MSARCPVFLGQLKPRLGKWRAALREEELPPPILPEVAFAGRSNVGKSSLLNELAGRRLTSLVTSRPGTTQHLHFFKAGSPPVLCLVDLPGYGFAKAAAATRLQWTEFSLYYLKTRKNLRRVFVLIDARHGLKESDKEMLHFLHRWGVSWQLVLTKADLVKPKDLVKTLMLVKEDAKAFRHQAADPVAVSALRHQALDVLRREMDGLKIDKEIVKHRIRLRIHSKLEERRLRRQLKAAAKKKTKSEEGREGDGRAHSLSRPSSWVTAACKEGVDLDSRGNAVDGEGAETGLDTPPILERVRRRWNFEDDFSSQETATGDVGSDLPRNTAGLEYEGGDTEQISLDTFIECTEMGQGSWHHRHSLEATAELLSASEFPHAAPSPLLNSDPRQEEQPIHRDRDLCGSEALQPLGRKRGRRRASGSNPSSGELLDVPAAGTEARLQSPDPCPAFFAAADAAAQLALGLNSSVAKEENGRRRERASTASFESGGEEDPRARVPRMDASSPFPKPSLASSSLAAPSPAFDVGEDATCRARGEEGDVLRPASRPSLAVDFDLSLRPGGSSESAGHAGAVTEGVKSEASEVRMGRGCFKDEVDALHLNRKMSTTESGAESEPGEVSFLSSALDSPALFDSLDDDEDPSFLLQRSLQGSSPSSSASPSGGPLSGSVSGRLRRAVQETQEICRSSWQAERVGVTSVAFELTEKAPDVEEEEDEGEDGFSSPFPSLAEARQAARTRKSRLRPAPSPRLSGVAMGQKGDVLLLEDAGHHTGGGGGQAGRRARRQRRSLSGDEAGRFGPDPDPLQQAPEPGVYTGDFERDMRQSWDRRKRMELEDLGNAPSRPLSLGSRSRDKIQSRDERPTPFWRRRKEADAMALSAEAGFIGLDPKALQRPVRGVQKRKLLRRLSRMRLHHLRLQPESVSKRLVAAVGKEAKAGFAAPGIIAAKDRKGGKNYTWEEAMRKWKRWARKHKADAAVYGRPNKRRLLEEQMQMVERKLFRQRLAMKKKEQNEAPGAGLVREFKQRKRQARELARGLEASQNGSFGGSGVMKNKKQSPRSRRLQRKKDEKLAELEAFREWKIQQENKRRGR